MTYLLDTNALYWAAREPRRLSGKARRICESPRVERVISVASIWELIGKCAIGKLSIPKVEIELQTWVAHLTARVLPVELTHAYTMYRLPLLHKDPFDRMLVAQAVAEGFTLVTSDEILHRYPVKWVW